ncbi:hypothetical protein GGI15_000873 [Coemansia interrupta]|uniref:Uncharacterized protein n=1 Tax=Coemansia interrupta TaxID=1126814 RepID=A0A9W8HKJ5_9FUNG|nr:hypothetical protein GGI15_000873 [Coemansia interrupta]
MTHDSNVPDNYEFRYSITSNISYMYQVYCSYIMVYKNIDGRKDFMNPELLQNSLTTLVRKHYPPVAGWFEYCNDEIEVVFRNDKFNDPSFETQTLDMDYNKAMEHVQASDEELFVPKSPSPLIDADSPIKPMFLVKATYLESNDAVILGVTYHHSLMDGSAFWLFLYNWANLCSSMSTGDNMTGTDYHVPCPPSFGLPSISHLHDPEAKFEHTEYTLVDAADCIRAFKPSADKIRETILRISVDEQHNIRDMAKKHGVSFTAMLCAIFWREMSRIRLEARPSTASSTSLFTCAVNPRAQLALSSFLCASPVVNLAASRTIEELAKMDLGDMAQLVSNTITKGTAPYVCSSMDFLVTQRKTEIEDDKLGRSGKKIMLAYVCPVPAKCTVSSSRNFPIYQTDFGFGSPEYVRPPYLPYDGCLRIWPTPESRGTGLNNKEAPLEVYLSQPDYVDLSKSPLLRPFVTS